MLTVITMYRSFDAEMFVNVVEGKLTAEQRQQWRQKHQCDEFDIENDDDEPNNMFFLELAAPLPNDAFYDLWNVAGDED